MAMRSPEELSNLIKDLITEYTQDVKMVDFGIVFQVGDGIARVYGLERAMSGELLEFEDGSLGIA
jgi:F-type H+-transporting ATPase subunit alpha